MNCRGHRRVPQWNNDQTGARSMSRKQRRYRLTGNRDHRQQDQPASQVGDRGGVQRGAACPDGLSPFPLSGTRQRYLVLAVCAFLLVAVALVFGQTAGYQFVNFDDGGYVYDNPRNFGRPQCPGNRLGLHARACCELAPIDGFVAPVGLFCTF